MSKIKNTPEFQKMMDEQELMASLHYAEQELEKEQLMKDLQAEVAFDDAMSEYRAAQETFMLAQVRFRKAIEVYRKHKELDNKSAEDEPDTTSMLRDMFNSFNPNH